MLWNLNKLSGTWLKTKKKWIYDLYEGSVIFKDLLSFQQFCNTVSILKQLIPGGLCTGVIHQGLSITGYRPGLDHWKNASLSSSSSSRLFWCITNITFETVQAHTKGVKCCWNDVSLWWVWYCFMFCYCFISWHNVKSSVPRKGGHFRIKGHWSLCYSSGGKEKLPFDRKKLWVVW